MDPSTLLPGGTAHRSPGRSPDGASGSERARVIWAPVGTGVRPQAETDFAIHRLFGDADGLVAVEEMETTLADIPGLDGIHVLSDAVAGAARRLGRPLGLG
jgi:hypothetical protein